MDAIVQGEIDQIIRLRKEVTAVARSFKHYPRLRRLSSYSTYASLGLGVVEALTGAFGPSILVGLIPVGLDQLARKWKTNPLGYFLDLIQSPDTKRRRSDVQYHFPPFWGFLPNFLR